MLARPTKLKRTLTGLAFACLSLNGFSYALAQDVVFPAPSSALQDAAKSLDSAWDASGLGFTTVTFTEEAADGYGNYVPRQNAEYADGDILSIYAEPVGYVFAAEGDDYSYALNASYRLLNSSGQVLAEQQDFAEFSGKSRAKQRELAATLSFQFTGLPAGSYSLETTFVDAIGSKSASFTMPFSIKTEEAATE